MNFLEAVEDMKEKTIDKQRVVKVLNDAIDDADDEAFTLRIQLIKHDLGLEVEALHTPTHKRGFE